ncbi:MAG: SDR family oxidoreductase [Ruminococcaceae bacterium]|nr:SDR family oxidoreductase [Oscillospiraceae bacterium]
MKALITGASSGIGRDIARELHSRGYEIIAVARRRERLDELKKELANVEIMCADVTKDEDIERISARAEEVDIFVNNAGFGTFGEFNGTDTGEELSMIDTNIRAVHLLMKAFVKEFKKRGSGHILNVASLAAFFPGPLFATYYATKAYVLRLSLAVSEELRRSKSKVKISVLCPGPVNTEFSDVAGMSFGVDKFRAARLVVLDSRKVAKYTVKKMLKGKKVIVPSFLMKAVIFSRHFFSETFLARIIYKVQNMKFIRGEK